MCRISKGFHYTMAFSLLLLLNVLSFSSFCSCFSVVEESQERELTRQIAKESEKFEKSMAEFVAQANGDSAAAAVTTLLGKNSHGASDSSAVSSLSPSSSSSPASSRPSTPVPKKSSKKKERGRHSSSRHGRETSPSSIDPSFPLTVWQGSAHLSPRPLPLLACLFFFLQRLYSSFSHFLSSVSSSFSLFPLVHLLPLHFLSLSLALRRLVLLKFGFILPSRVLLDRQQRYALLRSVCLKTGIQLAACDYCFDFAPAPPMDLLVSSSSESSSSLPDRAADKEENDNHDEEPNSASGTSSSSSLSSSSSSSLSLLPVHLDDILDVVPIVHSALPSVCVRRM